MLDLVPDEMFDDCGAILGRRGAGKSALRTLMFEHERDRGRRCLLIDPKGDSWGIRLDPDGSPSRFADMPIFGGQRSDIEITAKMGGALGKIIGSSDISAIVDLSSFTVAGMRRFMRDFAEALFDTNRNPLTLFVDEADQLAPQTVPGEVAMLLHHMESLIRQGRQRGIFMWMLTQRPQVLNKNLLSQAESLIAMRMTTPHDRKAIRDWMDAHDPAMAKEVEQQLSKLKQGEAYVWVPPADFLERVQFPLFSTYDSGRTPKHGETVAHIDLPKIEVSEIAEQLRALLEPDEPAPLPPMSDTALAAQTALIAKHVERIATLEAELAEAVRYQTDLAIVGLRVVDMARDMADQLEALLPVPTRQEEVEAPPITGSTEEMKAWLVNTFMERYPNYVPAHGEKAPVNHGISAKVAASYVQPIGTAPSVPLRVNDPANFSPSVRKILGVFEGLAPRAINIRRAALLGGISPKSSAFNRHLEAVKATGLIEPHPVDDEWSWAGPVDPNRQQIDPVAIWLGLLKPAPRAMLTAIANAERPLERDEAAVDAGISVKSSNVGKAFKELLSLKLIEDDGAGRFKLAEDMRI